MGKELSILIVDDDVNFAESTLDVLTECGYTCAMVHDGEAAVKKLTERSYDLVISDIKMPVMNGGRLVIEIKGRFPEVTVFLMTAFRDEALLQDAKKTPADKILYKPLNLPQLMQYIENLNN
ncbi:MAG: response regulator [Candidatus Omnitrophica bacterium]|nr:response regulator [Candidatus Omnitrophota bacterium]MCB9720002.1 response regulator [Candidatus Omnitrophota bacterium]